VDSLLQGEQGRLADELSTWIVHTEARRNPAALVTSALALDTVARKPGMDLAQVLKRFPMSQKGAQEDVQRLEAFLADPDRPVNKMSKRAKRQAQLEIDAVKLWVETLGILVEGDASAREVQERLKANIRERIFVTYMLSAEERRFVMERLGQER